MWIAFDLVWADFGNMYRTVPVWISEVKHKTFVEVNEQGTEAAAVTEMEMGFGYDGPPVFRID